MDAWLVALWQAQGATTGLCLLAVGGYGRRALFPYSDIDLLVLASATPDAAQESFLQRFFTAAWDGSGRRLGHAVRTVEDTLSAARSDQGIATTLLEMRPIAGDRRLLRTLRGALVASPPWTPVAFFAAKLAEQDARHRRFRDTAYHLEPNLKEGPGGLRDIHHLLWMAGSLFGNPVLAALRKAGLVDARELRQLSQAQAFLGRLRIALHVHSGRAEERLRLEMQEVAAMELGFREEGGRSAAERMMQRLYQVFASVLRISAVVEDGIAHFLAEGRPPALPSPGPAGLAGLLQAWTGLAEVGAELPAQVLRSSYARRQQWSSAAFRDPAVREAWKKAIENPARASRILSWLHQCGILGRLIPAFARVSGLIQHDLFHVYTVDQHTLFLLEQMALLWHNPPAAAVREAWAAIGHPDLLVLAGLFHDIGKGRGGDHSRIGADALRRFAHALDFSPDGTALAVWLVESHLQMSTVSQRRDLDDPQTIRSFAAWAGSRERLAYLLLLTVADMQATNPGLWNTWKASLLYKLFSASWELLDGSPKPGTGQEEDLNVAGQREAWVLSRIAPGCHSPLRKIWKALPRSYFLRYDADELLWQAEALLGHGGQDYLVAIRRHPLQGDQILVYGPDRSGLFEDIAGVLDRHSLNIVDARIDTGSTGHALDTFTVLDESHAYARSSAAHAALATELHRVLDGGRPAQPRFGLRHPDARHRFFARVPAEIRIDNGALVQDTLLEVRASDRMGLLYQVGGTLRELGFSIFGAKVSTFGERVEDTFFIRNGQGKKLALSERKALESALREVLQPPHGHG